MAKSYQDIAGILKAKLEELKGGDGTKLFSSVEKNPASSPEGNPIAWIYPIGGQGEMLDTARNERVWRFECFISQQITESISKGDAYDALIDAVDRTISAFDEDPYLEDSAGEARCSRVAVLPVDFQYASELTPQHQAILTVEVMNFIARH